MTKDQFISGQSFKIKGTTYKGDSTYKVHDNCIVRESRSSIDETVQFYNHHCNVIKIGKVQFEGFTYVFDKKVKVKYRFEDLVIFEEGV
jgi:hypothetical protein